MSDLSSLIADQWQPIETAPRDGTSVLVLVDGRAVESEFCEESQSWLAGWWGLGFDNDPTHWMPLPSPPRALQQKGSSNG